MLGQLQALGGSQPGSFRGGMAEIIDFTPHLHKKQLAETRAWLDRQGVMPTPRTLPEGLFDDEPPCDSEPSERE